MAALMESARADAAAGKLSTAAASIERALRIRTGETDRDAL